MKRRACPVDFAVLSVLVVVFLSSIFFTNVNLSYAGPGSRKSSAVHQMSAVEYTEAQIKQLESTLNITEAQKGLWDNLTQVMRENAKEMDALNQERAENRATMNSVERMKFHSRITEAHLAQLNRLIPPFEAFYASLSDQQKNITDMIFQTGRYKKHHRR